MRKDIPEQYRAKSDKRSEYLDETKKTEAQSLKDHHTEKTQPKRPSKMTGTFNQDLKQHGGKRAIDIEKEKKLKGLDLDPNDPKLGD